MKQENFFILLAIVIVIMACMSLVLGSNVFSEEAVVSPTRRPIKTPTSAPTETPQPENQFLPLILKSGEWRPTSPPPDLLIQP